MSLLDDVLKALDRWQEWKRMREAPDRIDELEKRLAAIEASPADAPGRECKACGKRAMRLTASVPDPIWQDMGKKRETWTCKNPECGFSEDIISK